MAFWEDTLSSSIGSFIGIIGAYGVAKWQLEKTNRENNALYYVRYNEARFYIENFKKEMEEVLFFTQGSMRLVSRTVLDGSKFYSMRDNLNVAIMVINPEIVEGKIDHLAITLGEINQNAPLSIYKEMNGLFYWMGVIYNNLLTDCEYLVNDLPDKLDMGFSDNIHINIAVKQFNKKYRRLNKKMKI